MFVDEGGVSKGIDHRDEECDRFFGWTLTCDLIELERITVACWVEGEIEPRLNDGKRIEFFLDDIVFE